MQRRRGRFREWLRCSRNPEGLWRPEGHRLERVQSLLASLCSAICASITSALLLKAIDITAHPGQIMPSLAAGPGPEGPEGKTFVRFAKQVSTSGGAKSGSV